jgi:hypothetical protein
MDVLTGNAERIFDCPGDGYINKVGPPIEVHLAPMPGTLVVMAPALLALLAVRRGRRPVGRVGRVGRGRPCAAALR